MYRNRRRTSWQRRHVAPSGRVLSICFWPSLSCPLSTRPAARDHARSRATRATRRRPRLCPRAAFRGIRFGDERSTVTANFFYGEGMGLGRVVLHSLLVDRAHDIVGRLRWGSRRPQTRVSRAYDGRRARQRTGISSAPTVSPLACAPGHASAAERCARAASASACTPRRARGAIMSRSTGDLSARRLSAPVGADGICVAVVTRFLTRSTPRR